MPENRKVDQAIRLFALRAMYHIMGKLKFLIIFAVCLAFGLLGFFFVSQNSGAEMVSVDLLFAGPLSFSVGKLILSSFFIGLVMGAALCLGYVFIQSLALRRARKETLALKKQLDHLHSSSLKDAL